MSNKRKVRNWAGQLVDAPRDLGILSLEDEGVRLSRDGDMNRLRVVYGLQVTNFTREGLGEDLIDSVLKEFEACVQHAKACKSSTTNQPTER